MHAAIEAGRLLNQEAVAWLDWMIVAILSARLLYYKYWSISYENRLNLSFQVPWQPLQLGKISFTKYVGNVINQFLHLANVLIETTKQQFYLYDWGQITPAVAGLK